ncbi:zinc finger C2HC domain-containing protein 1C [Triplophysa rosa]|uniref:Zinc finger C2HC domain-containing protein 1C n=1 Tax=Triplophysa rosa TaxID=992332 RepID=A0A9W7TVM4_TRIRA|nr:zinc finger C2HC domain-containing protein 1C [Triplophysa rosa]KAI7804447.1 putative zinc finger C2HC domain-containing protein 1C [Triplophysa rosa]
MQLAPHHRLTHHFWEKETTSPKLPFLHRENRRGRPSGMHHISEQHPWQPPARTHRRDEIFLEEQNGYVPSRRASDVDKVFPLKPVLHKRAYSLSNYHINSNVSEYQERFYSCLPRLTDVRQQQKCVRKPDAPKSSHEQITGRNRTTKSHSDGEHRKQKDSEKLSKEIHSKEMILQEKFYKAGETLRRIQRERTGRHDSVTRDERNERFLEKEKWENRLDSDRNDGWDRYAHERRESKDDMGRWEDWERKVNEKIKGGRRQPLTSEMTKLKDKRERDGYENTVKGRRGETMRENGMGWDARDMSHRRNLEEVEKYDGRRENMRKPGSSDRSHLRFTNVLLSERRESNETSYEPTSGGRRRKSPDRIPSQRGKRLLQVELSPEENAQELVACCVCQRHFLTDRLETHMRICEKKRPQRKIFDMSRHRAKGTELEEFMKTNGRSKTPEEVKKRNMWRQKHEAFIQIMRQGQTHVPQSALNLNPEYISCPHCGRTFAPGPAERHIPKCQNIRSRPQPPKQLHNTTRKKITRK